MRIKLCLTALICLVSTFGCKEEEEYVYPSVVTEFVDIKSNPSGKLTTIITDAGKEYFINERSGLEGFTKDTIYRTVSIFEPETNESSKLSATLYSCQIVPSMKPEKKDFFKDKIKTDPVDIERIWRAGNYINMVLLVQAKDKTHYFHFIEENEDDTSKPLEITLYHDQNNDYMAFTKKVYISLPLWQYNERLQKGDRIVLNINTFKEGKTEREFEF